MSDDDKEAGLRMEASLLGHNSGADPADLKALLEGLPSADLLVALLEAENSDALARVDALLARGKDFLVIDSDQADADATEFLVKLRARFTTSEAERAAIKGKIDELSGAVQAFFRNRILDPLGRAPDNKREEFDPVKSDQFGMGVRIAMAQTLYKRAKAEKERLEREAEAARLRKIEADAKAKRDAEAAEAKRKADAEAAAAKAKAEQEAAERKAAADKAAAEAKALADAAARKRNADAKAAADKAAAEAAAAAAKAKAEQEEADRKAAAEQAERDRIAAQEQAERDAAALAEENRLAEERAKAEEAAAATTADLSRARGGKGGVSSLREFVDFRDVKRDDMAVMLDLEGKVVPPGVPGLAPSIVLLLPFIKDGALETAIKDFEKANKALVMAGIKNGQQPVRGVTYFMNSKSAGRK